MSARDSNRSYFQAVRDLDFETFGDRPYAKGLVRLATEEQAISPKPVLVKLAYRIDSFIKSRKVLTFVLYKPWLLVKKAYRPLPNLKDSLIPANYIWRMNTGMPASLRYKYKSLNFKHHDSYDVSIVLLTYNKSDLTLGCLHSLNNLKSKYKFQVVLVDNCSEEAVSERLFSKVKNITYHRNDANLGFIGGCNSGVPISDGKHLVFLNNDTLVDKNWLDPLVDRLENDPTVGLTGSKLVYPDGTLQEAGGTIFDDATGYNFGKGDDPGKYRYNFARDVDYISGASIAISKQLFIKIGMFSDLYSPAYYEDTDLAFEVRRAGYRVVYEPKSMLIHLEGATNGLDVNTQTGNKKYQLVNHKKFYDKWQKVLKAEHYAPSHNLEEFKIVKHKKRALIVDHIVPEYDQDSGSVRMLRLIKVLQDMDYHVTFWPANLCATQPYTRQMQDMGVEVVYDVVSFIDFATENADYYDLVLLSRPHIGTAYIDLARNFFYRAKIIYDTTDLLFLRAQRQLEVEGSTEENNLTPEIVDNYKKIDFGLMRRADNTLVVSEEEAKLLAKTIPEARVSVVSNIHNIVNDKGEPFANRQDLFFIGGFRHVPNKDAVLWFCREIFPIIQKKIKGVKVHIVGSRVPEEVMKLANNSIRVHGFVEDVEPFLTSSRVFISPLRFGAGVKGKVGQAIEYGLPVVTTSIGAEGMHLKDKQSCLIADDAKSFSSAVVHLYQNEKLWHELQKNSKVVLEKYFSPQAAQKELEKVLNSN